MKNIQSCSNCIHSYKNRQVICFTCKPVKKDKMSNFKLLKEKRKNVQLNSWVEKSDYFNIFDKILFFVTGRWGK